MGSRQNTKKVHSSFANGDHNHTQWMLRIGLWERNLSSTELLWANEKDGGVPYGSMEWIFPNR